MADIDRCKDVLEAFLVERAKGTKQDTEAHAQGAAAAVHIAKANDNQELLAAMALLAADDSGRLSALVALLSAGEDWKAVQLIAGGTNTNAKPDQDDLLRNLGETLGDSADTTTTTTGPAAGSNTTGGSRRGKGRV